MVFLRAALRVAALALLGACASVPLPQDEDLLPVNGMEVPPTPLGRAQVVFLGDPALDAPAWILDEDLLLGGLRADAWFSTELQPGMHLFGARGAAGKTWRETVLQAGETAWLLLRGDPDDPDELQLVRMEPESGRARLEGAQGVLVDDFYARRAEVRGATAENREWERNLLLFGAAALLVGLSIATDGAVMVSP